MAHRALTPLPPRESRSPRGTPVRCLPPRARLYTQREQSRERFTRVRPPPGRNGCDTVDAQKCRARDRANGGGRMTVTP